MLNYRYILCILIVLFNVNAYALKSDESASIVITANQAKLNTKTKITTFTGAVIMDKGSFHLTADSCYAEQRIDKSNYLKLEGSPVYFSQIQDDGTKVQGQANFLDYDSLSGVAVLVGRARLLKGKTSLIGNKITYNLKSSEYLISGGVANGLSKTSGDRVTVIVNADDMKQESH